MAVHPGPCRRQRVEAVEVDGAVHRVDVGDGEADPAQHVAGALGEPVEGVAVRDQRRAVRRRENPPRVVEGAQVVDLVEVLRLPQRGDEPVASGDPLVHRADDRLQVADLVAPARLVQPVVAHELLRAHGQPGAGRRALHDERRHPLGHLGPGEVGQRGDLVGGHVAGHGPEEPRSVEERGDLARPGRGSAPSRCRARRAASCRRTAAARPARAGGTSPGAGPRAPRRCGRGGAGPPRRPPRRPGGTTRRYGPARSVRSDGSVMRSPQVGGDRWTPRRSAA